MQRIHPNQIKNQTRSTQSRDQQEHIKTTQHTPPHDAARAPHTPQRTSLSSPGARTPTPTPAAPRAARGARTAPRATPAVGLGLGPLGPTHATRDLERRERTTKVVATRAVNPGTTCPLIRLARPRGDGRARDRGRARGRSRRLDARGRAGLSVPVACPRHRASSPGLVRRLPPQHLPHFTFISTQPGSVALPDTPIRRRSIETPRCRESAP